MFDLESRWGEAGAEVVFRRHDLCFKTGGIFEPTGIVIRAARMWVAILIKRPPSMVLRISHNLIDHAGRSDFKRHVVHTRPATIMLTFRQIRRSCDRQISASRSRALPLGPLVFEYKS